MGMKVYNHKKQYTRLALISSSSSSASEDVRVLLKCVILQKQMETERFPIWRVTEVGRSSLEDVVATEFSLTITLNNQEVVTLLCSPANLEYLALGFLLSEGLLQNKDDIKKITVDERRGTVQVETEGELFFPPLGTRERGREVLHRRRADAPRQAKIESQVAISAREVFTLVDELAHV